MPNPDATALNPTPAPGAHARFDDRWLMALGIPGFGISIPLLTGLYGPLRPGQGLWWLGQALFLALAATVWGGNRWLLFRQREHFDWFSHPLRKLLMLVTANVLYTAPVTVGLLWLWGRVSGLPVDAGTLQVVALTNVICVLFVTHAYETLFLIRERESDLLQVARLQRAGAEAQLAALKAQVDPHFLFNSLNTLGHLTTHDPPRAREFCDTLADTYRYVLASREHDTVPLAEELQFVRRIHRLLALRFGPAMQLEIDPALDVAAAAGHWHIPPMGLQTLLENAVKHNRVGGEATLCVRMTRAGDHVRVAHAAQPRASALPGSGLGLANLDERCRFVTGQPLRRPAQDGHFVVEVPMQRR